MLSRNALFSGRSVLHAACVLLCLPVLLASAASTSKVPVIPKWARFEQKFQSDLNYSNPIQEAALTVTFHSPLGETFKVNGFWDGGRTWRVRFCPAQPGRWTYRTSCSTPNDGGLNRQNGEFLCTSSIGENLFRAHGPVRVARDGRHLEHWDGTPFFCVGDVVTDGARKAKPESWDIYAHVRSRQQFNAAIWTVGPGEDYEGENALGGFKDSVSVNPAFFQRLDAKLERLRQSGILSAIIPWSTAPGKTGSPTSLQEAQQLKLLEYAVARYGADPVVWVLPCAEAGSDQTAAALRKLGSSAFGAGEHAPVMIFAGTNTAALEAFRDQKWAEVFGYTVGERLENESAVAPARVTIPFTPAENGVSDGTKRFSTEAVRNAAYWGLLTSTPAGVTYAGENVSSWNSKIDPQPGETDGASLPLWEKALFMPAARQLVHLASLFHSMPFWHLTADQNLLATQPGTMGSGRFVAGALSPNKDLAVVYVPKERTVDLKSQALPAAPDVSWFNPRTGEKRPAMAVVGGQSCQFPTPDPSDWVLVLKGK